MRLGNPFLRGVLQVGSNHGGYVSLLPAPKSVEQSIWLHNPVLVAAMRTHHLCPPRIAEMGSNYDVLQVTKVGTINVATSLVPSRNRRSGVKLMWPHNLCGRRVYKVGRNQRGYITPAAGES